MDTEQVPFKLKRRANCFICGEEHDSKKKVIQAIQEWIVKRRKLKALDSLTPDGARINLLNHLKQKLEEV